MRRLAFLRPRRWLAAVALAGGAAVWAADPAPIVIPVVTPLSGATSVIGQDGAKAIELALRHIAEDGTVTVLKDNLKVLPREIIDAAKAKPGGLNYGHAGIGSASHLCMLMLMKDLGVQLNGVPYRGTGPAMNDLVAGQSRSAVPPSTSARSPSSRNPQWSTMPSVSP